MTVQHKDDSASAKAKLVTCIERFFGVRKCKKKNKKRDGQRNYFLIDFNFFIGWSVALQSLGVVTKQKCDGKRKSSVYRFINQFLVKSLVGMSSEAAGPACSAPFENLLFWACLKTDMFISIYVYYVVCSRVPG